MKKFLGVLGAVMVVGFMLAMASCGSQLAQGRSLEAEKERTDQIEALMAPAVVDAEYDGKTILEVVRTHNRIAEADADAIRALATYEMRRAEDWRIFFMGAGMLGACLVLVGAAWFVVQWREQRERALYEVKVQEPS